VVVWGASLGDLDSIRRRADIEALVQFDRLNRLWCSLAGCSNGRRLVLGRSLSGSGNGRLVLVTALSYLPAYLPACPCQYLIRFGGGVGPIEGSD